MMNFYCFENTDKTNWFDSDWLTGQRQYKNKNIIMRTSNTKPEHDHQNKQGITHVYRGGGPNRKEDMPRLVIWK
jgi:hypothetical protein